VIDTHCHLDLRAFDGDRDDVIARARAAGVRGMVVPAIRPRTWARLAAWREPGIAIALGVHPQVVPELDDDERALACDADALVRAIDDARAAGAPIVAVGECGLDGGTGERALQEQILRAHVIAARVLDLPLIVHVLRAHDAAPRLLEGGAGVMHSYSGGAAMVATYAARGFAFSFAGPITYPNARRPIEAARVVPAELLLAETDAPDQAPAPHRGGRSEPAMVASVIAGLATARAEDVAELAARTTANARRVFARMV
jgi:TatD DNase family protein